MGSSSASYQLPYVHEIDSVTADSNGLSVAGATVVDSEPVEHQYEQGHTYDQIGYVRDASSGSVVVQFVLLRDPGHPEVQIEAMLSTQRMAGHSCSYTGDSHRWLYTYSLSSFALLSIIDLGYDSFDPTMASHMIVWGTNRRGLQSRRRHHSCRHLRRCASARYRRQDCADTRAGSPAR